MDIFKAKKILVVLGSANSPFGELLSIAKDRLDSCFRIFQPEKHLILCTGGFGEHFNTSRLAHSIYAVKYLVSKGINEKYFINSAISSNTVDDSVKIKEILKYYPILPLIIISSDFHIKRVQLIFDEVLKAYPKTYFSVAHQLDPEIEKTYLKHEETAIQTILEKGLYF